jgi:chemotaxis protein CheD
MPSNADAGLVPDTPGASVNLLAGQFYFGRRAREVRTLLGSCVGITLWDPRRRLGGMCHFLLPERSRAGVAGRDGRFGDEAVEVLLEMVQRAGSRPADIEAHLYGGADTLSGRTGVKFNVGERNIGQGWALIDRHGFRLAEVDVGDHCPRSVRLSLADGSVEMRRGQPSTPPAALAKPAARERIA